MSGVINIPDSNQKRISDIKGMVYSLLGKVYLTKPTFFGLDSKQIIIIVSPTLKVLHVGASQNKLLSNFPQKVDTKLDAEPIMDWANDNDFVITFEAPTPKLNRILYYKFSRVLNDSLNEKTFDDYIVESKLPDEIKNKALDNQEWFKTNLIEIFKKIK